MTKRITFEGVEVEYDDSQLNKWSVMKQLVTVDGQFVAMDKILCGKSDAIAEALGDDITKMSELISHIGAANGNTGKN